MEQDYLTQTALDQMVISDQEQFMKALIPYLSPGQQQFMALYTKATELANTAALFKKQQTVKMQEVSEPVQPLDVLNDVRKYCFGNSRRTLDQMVNMMTVMEMMKIINSPSPEDNCETEGPDRNHSDFNL